VNQPRQQDHEYVRAGTAKLLTLFHPASGQVRVKGVVESRNPTLHGWLQSELTAVLAELPPVAEAVGDWQSWEQWQQDLQLPFLPYRELPPLRMLLVLDNLAGHKSESLVRWLLEHGIMPLYTPLSGSWLNMAESIQRILKRRALDGQHPQSTSEIIDWLEAVAKHWNREPTPFVWGGKRRARRRREPSGRRLGGSGAYTRPRSHYQPMPRNGNARDK